MVPMRQSIPIVIKILLIRYSNHLTLSFLFSILYVFVYVYQTPLNFLYEHKPIGIYTICQKCTVLSQLYFTSANLPPDGGRTTPS